jgi:Fe2+ transport system protein FeoA
MVDFIPLRKMSAGHKAEILSVEGVADHVHRLGELGLRSGALIEIFRSGNPCIIRPCNLLAEGTNWGNKLCLRTNNDLKILVKPADSVN